MTFWRSFLQTLAKNPVSSFAVLLVAVISGFLGYMILWQTEILTNAGWCRQASWAGQQLPTDLTTQQTLEILKSCNNLLMAQVEAIAADSHIDHGIVGLVLIVLVVVVISSARLAFKLSHKGLEGDLSRHGDPAAAGAQHVADEAQEAADDVKADTAPAKAIDPAMPDYAR